MNRLYFDDKNVISNLNKLIILAHAIHNEGYKISEIEDSITTEENNIRISFFKDDYDGNVTYENGGELFLELSHHEECIRLHKILSEKLR